MSAAPRTRVLIVDDEEEILELLGEYLRTRGFEVVAAYDGRDAMELLRSGTIDAVITDLKMPDVGGMELHAEIGRLNRPVATLIMTGLGTVETAVASMRSGAYDYILKPFKLREVYASLCRALERLAQERERALRLDRARFFEQAAAMEQLSDKPRLLGLLAAVARADLQASEVALWMKAADGWEAVVRGGAVSCLADLRPAVVAAPRLADGLLTAPIELRGQRVGLLALAGFPEQEGALGRAVLLCRVTAEALARAGA